MLPLVIAGAVGNCIDILEAVNAPRAGEAPYRCVGFVDDDPALVGQLVQRVPVLGPLARLRELGEVLVVVGIGSPRSFRNRAELIAGLGIPRERFATVLHPRASVSPSARVGRGSVVLANATLGAQARLGDHVLILQNSVIGHDSEVGDHCCVAGGAVVSGRVQVGDSCYVGAGAVIHDGLHIAARTMVGMGSVVVRDIPAETQVFGNPARQLR
jgi:sugar O-acyltransferase (sialic acid O-acetyltransferase NeuD family)